MHCVLMGLNADNCRASAGLTAYLVQVMMVMMMKPIILVLQMKTVIVMHVVMVLNDKGRGGGAALSLLLLLVESSAAAAELVNVGDVIVDIVKASIADDVTGCVTTVFRRR